MKYLITSVSLIGVLFLISTLYAFDSQKKEVNRLESDVVLIDAMKVFGELERPAVIFRHDIHTRELERRGKDCSVCHLSVNEKLVLKFNRLVDTEKETTLDVYHEKCISCHEESYNADLDAGPVECGECHVEQPAVIAAKELPVFDKSLHYRHIKSQEDTCNACHHDYDETKKELTYEKGKEDSCRSCHKEEDRDKYISYQAAAHQSCIACHQKNLSEKGVDTANIGPVKCEGCHEGSELQKIEKVKAIPRLERNQPDMTFVKGFEKITDETMNAVIFNHHTHENAVSTCRTCHHENMDKCESCHTPTRSEEGAGVTLAEAMHDEKSEKSCVGCHKKEQQADSCVGCHSIIISEFMRDARTCQSCHSASIEEIKKARSSGMKLSADHFKNKAIKANPVDLDALTSEIKIDVISDEYQAAIFPHRAIIESLMNGMKDNKLAAYYHQGENVICESCHHNSPGSNDPPQKCVNCHSASGGEAVNAMPTLKDAYHGQCFQCHNAMEISNPVSNDCVACHAEK
ncbi:hypothetical protein KJ966_20430 [bacterium]|nr:hypothetical protein [bacterium]